MKPSVNIKNVYHIRFAVEIFEDAIYCPNLGLTRPPLSYSKVRAYRVISLLDVISKLIEHTAAT